MTETIPLRLVRVGKGGGWWRARLPCANWLVVSGGRLGSSEQARSCYFLTQPGTLTRWGKGLSVLDKVGFCSASRSLPRGNSGDRGHRGPRKCCLLLNPAGPLPYTVVPGQENKVEDAGQGLRADPGRPVPLHLHLPPTVGLRGPANIQGMGSFYLSFVGGAS